MIKQIIGEHFLKIYLINEKWRIIMESNIE